MNADAMKMLNAKFPKKQIKRRKLGVGENERMVDYVTGSIVIHRLNEVFEGEWSFEVRERIVDTTENQIAVLGRLTVPRWRVEELRNSARRLCTDQAEGSERTSEHKDTSEDVQVGRETQYEIVKEQWGGATIERYKASKTIIDLGNNMKSATTDALKKCASLLGVGLHLYDVDEVVSTVETAEEAAIVLKKPSEDKPVDDNKPASKIQQQAVLKVLGAKKIEPEKLFEYLKVKGMDEITSSVAGSIITMKHDFWKGVQP